MSSTVSSHICSSCRRALSRGVRHRPHSLSSGQSRQLSYTRDERQVYLLKSHNYADVEQLITGPGSSTGAVPHRQNVATSSTEPTQKVAIGRYSRALLNPDQLLEQLAPGDDRSGQHSSRLPSSANASGRSRRTPRQRPDDALREPGPDRTYTSADSARTPLKHDVRSNPVLQDIDEFRHLCSIGEFQSAWQQLHSMADNHKAHELRVIKRNPDFEEQLARVVASIIDSWLAAELEGVVDQTASDHSGPAQDSTSASSQLGENSIDQARPLVICDVLDKLGLLSPGLIAFILCNTLKGTIKQEAHSDLGQGHPSLELVLQDVVRIWHTTLARHSGTEQDASFIIRREHPEDSLDWSFLPSEHDFKSLSVGAVKSLRSTVELFLPFTLKSIGRTDFASAAALTLHVLRQPYAVSSTTDMSNPTSSTGSMESDRLERFWRTVFESVPNPELPSFLRVTYIDADQRLRRHMSSIFTPLNLKEPIVHALNPGPVAMRGSTTQAFSQPAKQESQNLSVSEGAETTRPVSAIEQIRPQTQGERRDTAQPAQVQPSIHNLGSGQPHTRADVSSKAAATKDTVISHVPVSSPAEAFAALCSKRMSRAIEHHDAARADLILTEILRYEQDNGGTPRLPSSLYEQLVYMYTQMRLARRAEQVLGIMPQIGHSPTVRTWTTLIRGSSRMGDADALDRFWSLMLASGITPDAAAYGARVFALVDLLRPQDAIAALQEMGDLWLRGQRENQASAAADKNLKGKRVSPSESESKVNQAPRPTVAVGNAMISGIAGRRDYPYAKYIPEVLRWMGKFGLDLDVQTFNPLIRNAMSKGNLDEATALLKQMKDRGIAPDSETGRALVFGYMHSGALQGLKPEEQTQHLLDVFEDIETNHIAASLDERAYAIAIEKILLEHGNRTAAEKLLARMGTRGLSKTAHIYTILLDHYMKAQPPDYAAMEALWAELSVAHHGWGAKLDDTFFDRALERFSEHHRALGTSKISQILDHLSKLGKRPSWIALKAVAVAYVDRRDIASLSKLVHDLRFRSHLRADGWSGRGFGYKNFWTFIVNTGLLEKEGITSFDQVREKDKAGKFGNRVR